MSEKYIIRSMTREEVNSIAIDWAAAEGWNPGLHDASAFYTADPNGFFVGLLNNEPISCISAVAYGKSFGFIGFYIVKPGYRGKGYGLKIWNAALAYLHSQNIGLDGVIEQQQNYTKSGFKLAYSNIRFEGLAKRSVSTFSDILAFPEVGFDDIERYDAALFPANRQPFLKAWITQPESLALAALHDKQIVGFSVVRKCRVGYKIGPLFADNKEIANKLYLTSCNFVETGSRVYLDVPEINTTAIELAESYGMQRVFGTARMYTKSFPGCNINKIFGVSTFELG
jgi:ribosomal protein S18 acetylase RimI-like enzyme